jgi:hypothetical protein
MTILPVGHALRLVIEDMSPGPTRGPRLLLHSEPHCHRFDRVLLDRIVGEVDRWYDAFFARIAVKAS